ncbi:alpha/beta hydrolase [Marinirhabdus gelatinilytica]|uniref:Pimeloyl-ACP methyl ester carboxylesterase n=1 Tax=Marinirhabdus gelatinilytica TaxID=1703343 RepID=A0A370QFN2_9FLAO|nr:alpha/beta hydrolase [Marinirhabdus gelatinilytica]RDK87173.1 pimeloyl-ACP methyl ester carboxylesterase [Marinirhabdus gelatinilytica]
MSEEKTHVYFVPGLAAGKEIFKNIRLPKDRFEMHILTWQIPEKKEPIAKYAKRMASQVTHKSAVLVGVSFGGVVVQEMAHFLQLRKLIIISSVKNRKELPRRLKVARATRAYKLLPTKMLLSAEDLTKYSVGPRSKKRLALYQAFLHVRNERYLNWAIKNMVCWKPKEKIEDIVHIHGDGDIIFPIKNIQDCVVIEGGTHIMLLNKGGEVSKKIIEAISS